MHKSQKSHCKYVLKGKGKTRCAINPDFYLSNCVARNFEHFPK